MGDGRRCQRGRPKRWGGWGAGCRYAVASARVLFLFRVSPSWFSGRIFSVRTAQSGPAQESNKTQQQQQCKQQRVRGCIWLGGRVECGRSWVLHSAPSALDNLLPPDFFFFSKIQSINQKEKYIYIIKFSALLPIWTLGEFEKMFYLILILTGLSLLSVVDSLVRWWWSRKNTWLFHHNSIQEVDRTALATTLCIDEGSCHF